MNLVTVRSGRFEWNGAPFPVTGANNYYLAYASPTMRRNVLDAAKAIGFNILRAWAFLDCDAAQPGQTPAGAWGPVFFQYWDTQANSPRLNTGETGLMRLDNLIADAEQAGFKLILPLVNHWTDFGGMDQYVKWFGGGTRDQFYRRAEIRTAYKNYVSQILNRTNTVTNRLYKEEPAILAWELANEPQCNTRDGRNILLDWVSEMSIWVRQHDANHLLGVGDEGHFNGQNGVDCEAFLQLPDIDFGTCHLYPQTWNKPDAILFGTRWISDHFAAGRRAGKPMLLEEYGMKIGADGLLSAVQRNFVYRQWLHTVRAEQGDGDLAWLLAAADDSGKPYPDYDQFTFHSAADIPAIRDHVAQVFAGGPVPPLPPPTPAAPNCGVIDLWVVDASGALISDPETQVVVKRSGRPLGDPLLVDFSVGPVELQIAAFPAGDTLLEVTPRNYQITQTGFFNVLPQARLFLQVTVIPNS